MYYLQPTGYNFLYTGCALFFFFFVFKIVIEMSIVKTIFFYEWVTHK